MRPWKPESRLPLLQGNEVASRNSVNIGVKFPFGYFCKCIYSMKLPLGLHHSVSTPFSTQWPWQVPALGDVLDAFVFILVLTSQPDQWKLGSLFLNSCELHGPGLPPLHLSHTTPSSLFLQPHWLSWEFWVPRSHPPPYPGGLQPSVPLAGKSSLSCPTLFTPNHSQSPVLLPQEIFHGLLGWLRCLVYYNSRVYMCCSFMALISVVILYLFLWSFD